jgi:glycosyltransferase involved in cell wall biosynthesis
MEHADLAERMGRAARIRYEELFTLERSARDTVTVYRELLG